mgnify:CR=1 FL=1
MEPSAGKLQTEEQIDLEIEDPALLLQEMLKEQEEITKELNELLKEVM